MTDNLQTVADLAVEASGFTELSKSDLAAGTLLGAIVPNGATPQVIDLERYADKPNAKQGVAQLHTAASFSAYVSAHSQPGTSLYADRYSYSMTAVIDGNLPGADGDAGWGRHQAVFQARKTAEWDAWKRASGTLMRQADFAEFIEDHLADIDPSDAASPSQADMLSLAKTFQVKNKVEFESDVKNESGAVQLTYNETHQARGGQKGEIEVPGEFILVIRPFEDYDLYRVKARFRYRLGNGAVNLGFVLVRADEIERVAFAGKPGNPDAGIEAVSGIVQQVEGDTGINAFFGSAPNR